MDKNIRTAKEGAVLLGEIMKAAGDNPNVKEAGDNLGKTALTITQTINNILLPLAAVNYSFDKAHVYFKEKFTKEFSQKTDKIPQEDIIEPKASIAGPALQGLAFTHEEDNLKEMYLSLLATSMNKKISYEAHPAFVEIIRQLTSEEAKLLQGLFLNDSQPICEIRIPVDDNSGFKILLHHLINISDADSNTPMESKQYPSMIENWIRLGLVKVDYSIHFSDKDKYLWAKERPEAIKLQKENIEKELIFQHGVIGATEFGKQFAKAVGISN